MSKKIVLIIIVISLSFCFAKPKKDKEPALSLSVPMWYEAQDMEFPDNKFLTGRGAGFSRKAAQQDALVKISMFFKTSVEVRKELINEYAEFNTEAQNQSAGTNYYSSNSEIRSETEFMGIKFAEDYEDKKGNWYSLAYINKEEITEVYKANIEHNNLLLSELLNTVEREGNPVSAIAKIKEAKILAAVIKEYIDMLAVISPSVSSTFVADLSNKNKRINTVNFNSRSKLKVNVITENSKHNRIAQKLKEILTNNGWTISSQNPNFIMSISVETVLEDSPNYWFVRPMFEVNVSQSGKVVFNYDKSLDRTGNPSADAATNRAYLNIESDLEENFMKAFLKAFLN